jgi:COP9 signalosome complex subunit 4
MSLSQSDVREALERITASPASSKPDSYKVLLQQIFASPSTLAPNINNFADAFLGESLSILQSRPILSNLVTELGKVDSTEVKIESGTHVLQLLVPKAASYEEQDLAIKRIVADALEDTGDYVAAARILQSINLDGNNNLSPNERAAHWIKIVRLYLEEDQPENAVTYLNRIKNIFYDVTDRDVRLHFNLSQARILDSQRSFLEASNRYYDVSLETSVAEDERLFSLSQSMTCAVLSPAGPQRAATLAKLYKDERSKQIEEYGIMQKIFLNRLLTSAEVDAFSEKLAPHQKALTADGSTVLRKAVLEHNLLAASRLYRNIYTNQLGKILGVNADKAQEYAALMIEQGRLVGSIDQIHGIILFDGQSNSGQQATNGASTTAAESRRWDNNIHKLAERVERVASVIEDQYPVSFQR